MLTPVITNDSHVEATENISFGSNDKVFAQLNAHIERP